MKLSFSPVATRHHICCPSCGQPVLVVHPDRCEVPTGRYWLRDGDSIGPLYQLLSEPQRKEACDAVLMVGDCRRCGEDFYVATVSRMDGAYAEKQDYLHLNRELGPQRNYLCSAEGAPEGVPASWLVSEYQTDAGRMHEHTLGPWPLKEVEGVVGVAGVACCGTLVAGNPWEQVTKLLYPLWGAMRETLLEAGR